MSNRLCFMVLAAIFLFFDSLLAFGQSTGDISILAGTTLGSGFAIGLNTSDSRTDWLSAEGSVDMVMRYPGGSSTWGTVFITFGSSVPSDRPGRDMSAYQTLLLELSGDPGTSVDIGIKDSTQPDDGSEAKVTISLTGGWQTTQIPLSKFSGANLKLIYVMAEFVFGGSQAQTIRVRSVTYSSAPAVSTRILPQLAFGGGWYTALYFTNTGGIAASIQINFVADDGNPLSIPSLGSSSTTLDVRPGGTAFVEALNTGLVKTGYVSVLLPSAVVGYAVFRLSLQGFTDQEAVVLLSGDSATTSTLIWDESNLQTAVAIVNPSDQDTNVNINIRNTSGQIIATALVPMKAKNKSALYLRDLPGLSDISGRRGAADFTVSTGNVAVLGIRFNGVAFTSIPTVDR